MLYAIDSLFANKMRSHQIRKDTAPMQPQWSAIHSTWFSSRAPQYVSGEFNGNDRVAARLDYMRETQQ